jgi:hypothetical protein
MPSGKLVTCTERVITRAANRMTRATYRFPVHEGGVDETERLAKRVDVSVQEYRHVIAGLNGEEQRVHGDGTSHCLLGAITGQAI